MPTRSSFISSIGIALAPAWTTVVGPSGGANVVLVKDVNIVTPAGVGGSVIIRSRLTLAGSDDRLFTWSGVLRDSAVRSVVFWPLPFAYALQFQADVAGVRVSLFGAFLPAPPE